MTGNNLLKAEPWIETARNDCAAAHPLREGGFWSLTCFLCQQAAEKALKAFLRAYGETASLGHGLTGLCHRCAANDPDLMEAMDSCRRLGRHYVPTRYPDAVGDEAPDLYYTQDDAGAALEDAGLIIGLVETKMAALRQTESEKGSRGNGRAEASGGSE